MAQSSQLATLSHKGTIQTFYGANALSDAYKAAVHGDVITLSSGSFNGVSLYKNITVRGAGVGMDTINKTLPTIINSEITISAQANDTSNLVLEGVMFTARVNYYTTIRPMFLKCKFKTFVSVGSYPSNNPPKMTDATFMHCLFTDNASFNESSTGTIINSVFKEVTLSNFTCVNSILFDFHSYKSTSSSNPYQEGGNCNFYNCIIYTYYNGQGSTGSRLLSSNLAYNCVGYTYGGADIFSNIPDNSSNILCKLETIFVSEAGSYSQNESTLFQLSEKGRTFLGNDGKEVGIYGGNMPFDLRTTTPQITKCNVAAKSTVDGKLSVDIEVSEIE